MSLIMRAGETMTCESGHRIATAKKDISTGETCDPDQFDWHVAEPASGDDVTPCPICGADYMRAQGGVYFVWLRPHTEEGWKE
jgi:hypothetical protein